MIDAALFAWVTGNAGVSALIGARMYPTKLDQAATLPAISYQQVSEDRQGETLAGPSTVPAVLFQFDCWANTNAGARALARAVRLTMDSKGGTFAGETIQVARLINQTAQYEPVVQVYRVLQEWRISWNEQ